MAPLQRQVPVLAGGRSIRCLAESNRRFRNTTRRGRRNGLPGEKGEMEAAAQRCLVVRCTVDTATCQLAMHEPAIEKVAPTTAQLLVTHTGEFTFIGKMQRMACG